MFRTCLTGVTLSAVVLAGGLPPTGLTATAAAEQVTYQARLNAASEVPPNDSKGTGQAVATLDTATRQLVYTVTFQGLTGPASMAHFHGPAAAGANAGITVKLGDHPTSPIKGSAQLTEAQVADLEAGKWYANVHTAGIPTGEIRGQMERAE
jgi:type 1 fimbria pilin